MAFRRDGGFAGTRMSHSLTAFSIILCGIAARVFWLQLEPPSGFIRAFEWLLATLLLSGLVGAHGLNISRISWVCIVLAFWVGELSTLFPVPQLGDSWRTFLVSIVLINVTPVLVVAGIYAGRMLSKTDSWGTSHNALFKSQFDRTKGVLHAHRLPTQPNC